MAQQFILPIPTEPLVDPKSLTTKNWRDYFAGIQKLAERVMFGTGSPEGAVNAQIGTGYFRLDGGTGTSFYIKESGAGTNTGWVAVAAAPSWKGALVKKASDLTLQDLTSVTVVTWDTETEDVGGWHESVTNPSRLTVPAGVTRVRMAACFAISSATSGETLNIEIRKNGGGSAGSGLPQLKASASNSFQRLAISSAAVSVTAGDYFEVYVQVQTDTSVTIEALLSWFSIEAVN